MSDINTGHTWSEGEVVTAGGLNNMLNDSVIQPEFLSAKSVGNPLSTDKVLFHEAATNTLKVSNISTINALAVPIVQPNTFLAGPASGFANVPTYRTIKTRDLVFPTVLLGAGTNIDWSLGNAFSKLISANATLTFSNDADGQTIRILLLNSGGGTHTITWPSVVWQGGSAPVLTTTGGHYDVILLSKFSTVIFGYSQLNFF